jgi:hypothetical protein
MRILCHALILAVLAPALAQAVSKYGYKDLGNYVPMSRIRSDINSMDSREYSRFISSVLDRRGARSRAIEPPVEMLNSMGDDELAEYLKMDTQGNVKEHPALSFELNSFGAYVPEHETLKMGIAAPLVDLYEGEGMLKNIHVALDVGNNLVGGSLNVEVEEVTRFHFKLGYGKIFGVAVELPSGELTRSDNAFYAGAGFRLW